MDWRYRMLLGDHREMFGNMRPIFDGAKCVARVKLPDNVSLVFWGILIGTNPFFIEVLLLGPSFHIYFRS